MPDKEKKKEEEVLDEEEVVVEEEPKEDEESTTIDLEDEEEPQIKEEDKEKRAQNKAFASMRIENKQLKEAVDKLTQQVSELSTSQRAALSQSTQTQVPNRQYVNGVPLPQTEKEWDELASKDWKLAVDLRSKINAQTILNESQTMQQSVKILDESKQKVLARHPELSDNNSEKAKIYTQILTANPQYINDPKGPIHAMRDMEEYMEEKLGYKREEIVKAERRGRETEAERINRVSLSSVQGRHTQNGKQVVLTKDEMEFCKLQGLDPKEYARNKLKLEKSGKSGGIQL